jgi:hypothetical protein
MTCKKLRICAEKGPQSRLADGIYSNCVLMLSEGMLIV